MEQLQWSLKLVEVAPLVADPPNAYFTTDTGLK